METIVCSLNISNSFEEWVHNFDHVESSDRLKKGINVLFRGVSKDNPSKVVVIVQAEDGVIPQHIQENVALFTAHGALMETALPSSYVDC